MGVILTGCSSSSEPAPDVSATAGASASATASAEVLPSPTSTLSAEEQQAFEEATAVVLAYRQTITDLYSGARTNLNDLNDVATGDLVDQGLTSIQQSLNEGWSSEPVGAQITLFSAEPTQLDLNGDPPTMVVEACIDTSDVVDVSPDGVRDMGTRERAEYSVTRTDYLPAPGWAVSEVSGAERPEDRLC